MRAEKICTRCNYLKKSDCFRVRIKNGYSYLNPTCKDCDNELRKKYHEKKKKDAVYMQKNRDRVLNYRNNNLEKCREKQRERIKTKEWKDYMKKWILDNKDTVLVQNRVRGKRWMKKQRDGITEQYILTLLSHPREGLGRGVIKQYPELVKFYQSHIKLKRLCKQKSKTSDN